MDIPNYLYKNKLFWINKRIFDIVVSIFLIPLLILSSIFLLILNHFFNPGRLFFIQERMGKNCKSFYVIKFRTMTPAKEIIRQYSDSIEIDRITFLGKIMRKFRIDELPQIINVLRGEMSIIGPRPDYFQHALVFLSKVEGYRQRHDIRPGITGLSQIKLGYAIGIESTLNKTTIDNYYIHNIGYVIEAKIIIKTILTIIKGKGK